MKRKLDVFTAVNLSVAVGRQKLRYRATTLILNGTSSTNSHCSAWTLPPCNDVCSGVQSEN